MDVVTIFIRKVLFVSLNMTYWVVSPIAAFANRSLMFLSAFTGSGKCSVLLLPGNSARCCMPPSKHPAPSSLNTNQKCSAPWKRKKKRHTKPGFFFFFFFRFQLVFSSICTVKFYSQCDLQTIRTCGLYSTQTRSGCQMQFKAVLLPDLCTSSL